MDIELLTSINNNLITINNTLESLMQIIVNKNELISEIITNIKIFLYLFIFYYVFDMVKIRGDRTWH